MALYATANNQTNFTPCPAGLHPAICYAVIDLGTQSETYQGKPRVARKVRLMFELVTERMADGKPFVTGVMYTNSLLETANLRKHLAAWRGRDFTSAELEKFDLFNVAGAKCQINVIHKPKQGGGVSDIIQAILPANKAVTYPALVNPVVKFAIDEWDQAAFDALPQWIKNKITASPEGAAKLSGRPAPQSAAGQPAAQPDAGEIPF